MNGGKENETYVEISNEEGILNWYINKAEKGDADAAYRLGDLYARGATGRPEPEKAAEWFRRAQEMKSSERRRIEAKKIERWRVAVEKGDATAAFQLGEALARDARTTQDFDEAIAFYVRAAKANRQDATRRLGDLCFEKRILGAAIGLETRLGAARALLEIVESGDVFAKKTLVELYYRNNNLRAWDELTRLRWTALAEPKNSNVARRLGKIYANGTENDEPNWEKADEWFQRAKTIEEIERWRVAAENGDAEAARSLSDAYRHGAGLERDKTEAKRWLRRAEEIEEIERWRVAAKDGSAKAARRLAEAYRDGRGVKKDGRNANFWFNRSIFLKKRAQQTQTAARSAKSARGGAERTKTRFERIVEEREKIERLRVEAEKGDAGAMRELGRTYYSHTFFRNIEEARYWLQKAVNYGDTKAGAILKQVLTDIEKPRNPREERESGGSGREVWFRYKGIKGSVLRIKTR